MPRRRVNRYAIGARSPRVPPHYYDLTRADIHPATMANKAAFTTWISNFTSVMADPRQVSPNLYSALIQDGGLSNVDVFDMLYWLDVKLKANKATLGYTTRLSQANGGSGWGTAAPNSLTNADPLDLVTTLEGLGVKVAIIDSNAIDDADASSQNGPVLITYGGGSNNPCKLLDGTTAKSYQSSPNLFTDSNKNTYRYRLWGGTTTYGAMTNLDERSGGSSCRIPRGANKTVILVRSGTDSQWNRECVTRQVTGDDPATYVILTGYPGEHPKVICGNQTDNDASPTTIGTASFGGGEIPGMLTLGSGSNRRDNFHIRNIEFSGGRKSLDDATDECFAAVLVYYTAVSSGSVRFCSFTDFQYLEPGDANAATFPNLVDTFHALRVSATMEQCTGLWVTASDMLIDSNYFYPRAVAAWPTSNVTNGNINGFAIDASADNIRITRNTFKGIKTNSMVRLVDCDNAYFADNKGESYDKSVITCSECDGITFERNRMHRHGITGYALEGGGAGISVSGCRDIVMRHNVIANVEPQEGGGIIVQTGTTNTGDVYGNLLYRTGIYLDHNVPGTTTVDFYNNLHVGIPNAWRTAGTPDGIQDAQFRVNYLSDSPDGTLKNATIRDCAWWRFPNANPTGSETGAQLAVYLTSSTSGMYDWNDALAGWSGHVYEEPGWVGDPENATDDFRLDGTNTYASWFPSDMPFRESDSLAWSPS